MRKIFLVIAIMFIMFPLNVYAAGTCAQTWKDFSPGVKILTFSCIGDAADGTFPATVSEKNLNGYVFMVVTNPGAPALTDDYDISMVDTDGLDITGGLLANRDQAVAEVVIPKVDLVNNLFGPRYVKGKVTMEITGNSVLSGVIVISVYVSY